MALYSVITILFVLIAVYLYTVFHELGHATIGILCGGSIKTIQFGLGAYVDIVGARYNTLTRALLNTAGLLNPILVYLLLLLIYRSDFSNFYYQAAYLIWGFVTIVPLLIWVILPLLSYRTTLNSNEDVMKFIAVTGMAPWLVSLLSLTAFIVLITLPFSCGNVAQFFHLFMA